jgi:hypothetical protein
MAGVDICVHMHREATWGLVEGHVFAGVDIFEYARALSLVS